MTDPYAVVDLDPGPSEALAKALCRRINDELGATDSAGTCLFLYRHHHALDNDDRWTFAFREQWLAAVVALEERRDRIESLDPDVTATIDVPDDSSRTLSDAAHRMRERTQQAIDALMDAKDNGGAKVDADASRGRVKGMDYDASLRRGGVGA
jgi:hypothetical protein